MSSKSAVAKVSQPYAEALLELVKQTSCATNDTNLFLESLKSSEDLQNSLSNPLISSSTKKEILSSIFGDQLGEVFLSFLMVLVDRNRIGIASTVLEKYLELAYQISAVTIADVATAIPFTPEQHDLLTAKIKTMTNAQEVKLVITINPELIGGFTIQIGSKVIDTSLQGQLKQMAFYLECGSFLSFIRYKKNINHII
nr:AtpD [Pseudoerythrocladia kornmannii]